MKPPQGEERTRYVRRMFARIAGRYDLLNRLMTFGQDRAWRTEAIQHLAVQPGQRILDAGSGTGDIALQIVQQTPGVRVVAADLTPEMMAIGRQRPNGERVAWVGCWRKLQVPTSLCQPTMETAILTGCIEFQVLLHRNKSPILSMTPLAA